MSDRRPNPILGIVLGAAGVAAGVAAGIAADRAGRHRAALDALETTEQLEITPDEDRMVLTKDGVALHVEIDLPAPEAAAAAAKGLTSGDDPARLPTIVLSHGYCLSLRSWVYQRRALKAAGYRVVSWDHRGHGQSGRGDPTSYVMDQLGDDLKQVIDEVAPTGHLILAGHSMGGMSMLALGERHPDFVRERVAGAAFIGTSAGGLILANGGRSATFGRLLLERLGPSVLGPLGDRPELMLRLRRLGRDLEELLVEQNSFASPVPRSVVRHTADMLMTTPPDVIRDFLLIFDGFDKRPALAEFKDTVTLVFNGKQDVLTPPEHSELIVEGIPGAEHIVVNDAGHIIMLEHPDLLSAHLLELAEQGTRAREEDIEVSRQPRVRRIVTDVAKSRRQRRIEREADELVRAERARALARLRRAQRAATAREESRSGT
ncbi:MAG TPA: alpha/beta hydrolase [Intrasporangium sp.]|uniref:alpha/beta fold hydrolase n=1 Tax=Intrasporangium sp. TaxID=1925024 RepID=UPI002F93C2ED